MFITFFEFEYKELEVNGHLGILLLMHEPPGGVQNMINKATNFAYGE